MLEYDLKYGKLEDGVIRQHLNTGQKLPDFIENRPDLLPGLSLYYGAFIELSSDRQIGMSIGPIPRRSVIDYARMYEFDSVQTEDLLYHIRKLDKIYVDDANKPAPETGKGNGNASRPRRTNGKKG